MTGPTTPVTCPGCGEQNDPSRTYCARCGRVLGEAPTQQLEPPPDTAPPHPQPQGSRTFWIAALILAAIVIGGLLVILRLLDGGGTAVAGSTTSAPTTTSASSTTAPADLAPVEGLVDEAQILVDRAASANQAWDDETASFSDTREELVAIVDATEDLAARARELSGTVDADLAGVVEALDSMATHAQGMVDGLDIPPPDTGEFRRAELERYREAFEELRAAVEGFGE